MDLWLESQGYCRKPVARDGSCLFRAVAEQIFKTQRFHLNVRNQCINYMKEHSDIFEDHEVDGGIDTYLKNMLIPTQSGSMLEIEVVSKLYKVDVLIFKEIGLPAENVSKSCFEKKIFLCQSQEQQYDPVNSKEFSKIAGFCQSLVYEILYKNVFHMKDVDLAVAQMLHHKAPRYRGELGGISQRKFFSLSGNSMLLQRRGISLDCSIDTEDVDALSLLGKGVTPFPYKVAKSLDPGVYRNVEFDVWIDYRRGLRYFGSHNELRVGVKCHVNIDDTMCIAHIQEMELDNGPVVVFVEELGEKRTVPYASLELLPQELQAPKPVLLSIGNNSHAANGSLAKGGLQSPSNLGGKFRRKKGSAEDEKVHVNTKLTVPENKISGQRKGSNRSKNAQNCVTYMGNTSNNDYFQDSNMTAAPVEFQTFSIDPFSNSGYPTYQMKTDMDAGVPVASQAHMFLHSPPMLIPVSPRPEDIPPHWLPMNAMDLLGKSSSLAEEIPNEQFSQMPNDSFNTGSFSSVEEMNVATSVENSCEESYVGDHSVETAVEVNSDFPHDTSSPCVQINYNAPKSVLESGVDLPLTDIQTLRYFYNLGNEFYHNQCSMYSFSGYAQGYNQPIVTSTPSPAGSPGVCPGKLCPCGPVCITTVPTIHHLLEPSTPPPNPHVNRKDYEASLANSQLNEQESPLTHNYTEPSSNKSTGPRFKKDSKGKAKRDLKVYQGQSLQHQHPLQRPCSSLSAHSFSQEEAGNDSGLGDDSVQSIGTNESAVSVPYSPTYGYVYYPNSPGVSFSPLEPSDRYVPPLRLQCPGEYITDTSPSSPCFSVTGDLYTTAVFPTSPHYLYPTSPGIFVGSPQWTPVSPSPASAQ